MLCGSNRKGWMLEIGGKEDEETINFRKQVNQ
jgi:hypothetical protein